MEAGWMLTALPLFFLKFFSFLPITETG